MVDDGCEDRERASVTVELISTDEGMKVPPLSSLQSKGRSMSVSQLMKRHENEGHSGRFHSRFSRFIRDTIISYKNKERLTAAR